MQATFGTVGISVCSLALILNVIGLAIPYWFTGDTLGSREANWHLGLWDFCGDLNEDINRCFSSDAALNPLSEARKVVQSIRAMELLGMFTCVAALTFSVIKVFNIKILLVKDDTLAKLSGVSAIIAGVFMLIGVIVCAAEKKTILQQLPDGDLHAGFGLCVVSGVLSIASGVIFVLNRDVAIPYTA